MALALTSIESGDPIAGRWSDPERWQRRLRYAVYGGVIPVTALLVIAAGWYIGTGETPAAVVRRLTSPPGFSMALPPPGRPPAATVTEKPKVQAKTAEKAGAEPTALLQPPTPAIGVIPPPPPPPKPPSAGGAMPSTAQAGEAPDAGAAAKTAEANPAAIPSEASAQPAAPSALTPMKPTPMNKVAEMPPAPPAATATPATAATTQTAPPAPATASPGAETAPGSQPGTPAQQTALAAPPPPPMNEPLAPPSGEPLAPPSFAQLPARTDLKPLPPAPQPDLLKDSPDGPLPVADGSKEPRTAYARAFVPPKDKAVKVAIVVVGLGLSREAAEAAIAKLPPEVDLSFSPYAGNLDAWVKKARDAGHEVLLDLPLEPPNFPLHDAGPLAILARDNPASMVDRLRQILGKTTSYVGLAAALHSPVSAGGPWTPLLREVRERGLLLLGDGFAGVAPPDIPAAASVALVPDETPFRAAIDAGLDRLLATAQRDGMAVAYVSPRPVTFERLVAWFATLPQKGAVLAPASALVQPPQS